MAHRGQSLVADLALVSLFAGLISAAAVAPAIPFGPVMVPITLQSLAVALTGMVLGPWRGFGASSLYLLIGLAGVPVFAGGASGLDVLTRPSAGYLLAFTLAAPLIGSLSRLVLLRVSPRSGRCWALLLLAGLTGSIVFLHPLGIAGISLNGGLSLGQAFLADMLYWPGDVVKNAIASALAIAMHRSFPGLLPPHSAGTSAPVRGRP